MTEFQMRVFLTAAETLNFTAASARLYLTQPALSRQIASLENELGVKLFLRQNNVLELTECGKFFYGRLKTVHADLEEAVKQVRDLDAGVEGHLRLGVMSDQQFLPAMTESLQTLLLRNANIKIDIRPDTYIDLLEQLDRGEIDAFQALLYDGLSPALYQTLPITREPMYFAFNPKFVRCGKKSLQNMSEVFELLGPYPLFLPDTDTYPESIREHLPLNDSCSAASIHLVDNPSITFLHLNIGSGASIINRNNLAALNSETVLIPFEGPPVLQGVVWRRNATNPILHLLMNELETYRLADESAGRSAG